MLHAIATAFFRPGGPYLYVRLVPASYAISAIARLIPVKSKQVPGYRPRFPAVVWYGGTTLVTLVVVACAFLLSQASGPAQRPAAALGPARPLATPLPQVRAG